MNEPLVASGDVTLQVMRYCTENNRDMRFAYPNRLIKGR